MTTTASLPFWNSAGVLPPIEPGAAGHSPERSPYLVDLVEFVNYFSISPERSRILEGLLLFREQLHSLGIVSGFQWLDGSYMEDIETLESRPPNDMDVVTFFHLPPGESQKSLVGKAGQLFNPRHLKATYAIDGYFSPLGQQVDAFQVKSISYWYSMWSHRRDGLWKGFVQIDLEPSQDANARAALITSKGGP